MSEMTLVTEGDTDIVVTRRFAVTPEALYLAHVSPAVLRQWVLGPDGWSMPVCVCDARPGGEIRYEWVNDADGVGFHLTGEFLEVDPYKRTVHVERMFLPDPTPDNHIETRFEKDGDGSKLVMRMTLPNAEIREIMLSTGMADGMEASYARLDKLI